MILVRVNETIHYKLAITDTISLRRKITPGLVDKEYLLHDLGPELYTSAQWLGVIEENPSS